MLTSSILCDVISFFATRKCQKSEKPMKIDHIEGAYLLNNLRNFNDIFRKDVAYDNIKSDKKLAFSPLSLSLSLSLEATFLKKTQEGGKIDPPQPF